MCLTGEVSHSFPLTAVTIRAITFWLPWIRLWRFIPAAGEAAATTQTHVSSQADSASRDERYLKANLHMSDPLRQQLHWLSSKNPAGMNCPLQHTHLVSKHNVNLKPNVEPVCAVEAVEPKTRKKSASKKKKYLFGGNGDRRIWKMLKKEEGTWRTCCQNTGESQHVSLFIEEDSTDVIRENQRNLV